jgi:hypothetical protein
MSGLSLDVLRIGKRYRVINFGDRHDFVIERILPNGDFNVKDIHTLERYKLKEIYQYGKGKDFEIRDLE